MKTKIKKKKDVKRTAAKKAKANRSSKKKVKSKRQSPRDSLKKFKVKFEKRFGKIDWKKLGKIGLSLMVLLAISGVLGAELKILAELLNHYVVV